VLSSRRQGDDDLCNVAIKTLTGKQIPLVVAPSDTVLSVREQFQQKEGIHPDQTLLIFNRMAMQESQSLSFYGVTEVSVIPNQI